MASKAIMTLSILTNIRPCTFAFSNSKLNDCHTVRSFIAAQYPSLSLGIRPCKHNERSEPAIRPTAQLFFQNPSLFQDRLGSFQKIECAGMMCHVRSRGLTTSISTRNRIRRVQATGLCLNREFHLNSGSDHADSQQDVLAYLKDKNIPVFEHGTDVVVAVAAVLRDLSAESKVDLANFHRTLCLHVMMYWSAQAAPTSDSESAPKFIAEIQRSHPKLFTDFLLLAVAKLYRVKATLYSAESDRVREQVFQPPPATPSAGELHLCTVGSAVFIGARQDTSDPGYLSC